MNAALIALREAVNKACKFMGPGSRTGGILETAMLAAERAAREGAAPSEPVEVFDKGPWTYRTDPKAETHLGRYFIESDDFSHDVRLYINGDFGSDDDRRVYGEALAATLNRAVGATTKRR